MNMIETLGAFLIGGAVGAVAKEKLMGPGEQAQKLQNELSTIYNENEKLKKRNKDLERQTEDLLAELKRVRKHNKENEEDNFDIQDSLDKSKREVKNLRLQNDDLAKKVKEYKNLLEAKEAEIELLKDKLG